jgi:hypothetical protein
MVLNRAPAGHEVDDEDHERDYEQQVNQAACNVQTESQEPQDQQNYKYGPEQGCSPFKVERPEGPKTYRAPV